MRFSPWPLSLKACYILWTFFIITFAGRIRGYAVRDTFTAGDLSLSSAALSSAGWSRKGEVCHGFTPHPLHQPPHPPMWLGGSCNRHMGFLPIRLHSWRQQKQWAKIPGELTSVWCHSPGGIADYSALPFVSKVISCTAGCWWLRCSLNLSTEKVQIQGSKTSQVGQKVKKDCKILSSVTETNEHQCKP